MRRGRFRITVVGAVFLIGSRSILSVGLRGRPRHNTPEHGAQIQERYLNYLHRSSGWRKHSPDAHFHVSLQA
jgi:hypothetical protein